VSAKPAPAPLVPFEKAAVAQSDRGKRVKQRDYLADGRIPVIDQGQSPVGGYTNDEDFAFTGELPVVLFGDHTRAVKLVDRRFAVGADGIKIFRPAEGVRAKYLYYWMKSAPLPDRGYGRHYQYLRQLSLPLPSPKQQDEIVAEIEEQFSRLDEAVVNLKRVKANLKRYKAAVLTSATRGELLPGAGPFGSIPLAELCGDGLFVDGDWVESKDQDPAGDVRLVQLADVGDGEFRNKSARFLTREKAGALGCTFLKAGDLLVARMPDPLGRACIFPGDAKDCVTVVDVCIVRPDLERADRRWLMHCINAPQVRQQVASLEAGSTRKRISRKNLANVVVPAVPKPLQTQIAAEVDRRLSFVEAAEESVLENEAASFGLRHSILQRAFGQTG